ncbi:hypothetical protein [Mesorhizobium sp. M0491]|uniref:hypothetical protein n=1 Tax=Mesorhizobium sp. M0491 TaxID=2956950 RepID=UPI003335B469
MKYKMDEQSSVGFSDYTLYHSRDREFRGGGGFLSRLGTEMRAMAEEIWFRVFFHFLRIFGIAFRAIAALIGLCALADLFRLTHFGYPDFSLILVCGFYAAGHYIAKIAGLMLRRGPGISN